MVGLPTVKECSTALQCSMLLGAEGTNNGAMSCRKPIVVCQKQINFTVDLIEMMSTLLPASCNAKRVCPH